MTNVAPFTMPGRQLSSWIAGFLEFTEGIQSSTIHRRWAAIATIAGALERKVWCKSQGENIYPNIYAFLVGPPGAGKTRALMACWRLWNALVDHHVAEISLTKAALIDKLSESHRTVHFNGMKDFHSLLIAAPELGALLPGYDSDFMNTLTHLYDGHLYTERRRTAKQEFVPIERPNINLIACTTPGFLVDTMPASAWNQGFLSRVCIAYSGEITIKDFDLMDEAPTADPLLEGALVHDLKKIAERVGRIAWTKRAADMAEEYNRAEFDVWHEEDGTRYAILPKPKHPRLMHYSTRRPVHFLKLCIICAADRGADNIDVPDVMTATDILAEIEMHMGDVFAAMSSGGDVQVMNDCLHWLIGENVKAKNAGINVTLVHEFLMGRAPATHCLRIYEMMIKSDMIRVYMDGTTQKAKPKPKL